MGIEQLRQEIFESVENIKSESTLKKLQEYIRSNSSINRLTFKQEEELSKSKQEMKDGKSVSFGSVISKYL